ncbi:MAG: hypothetical protein WAV15_02215 [Minisyncoccia bacterium]
MKHHLVPVGIVPTPIATFAMVRLSSLAASTCIGASPPIVAMKSDTVENQ